MPPSDHHHYAHHRDDPIYARVATPTHYTSFATHITQCVVTAQMRAILHAADIGNHIRPFPVALAAAGRVHSEFRRQVARERDQGLPVSPHMDCPEQAWHKMEVSFIDYIAGPLWERLAQVKLPTTVVFFKGSVMWLSG